MKPFLIAISTIFSSVSLLIDTSADGLPIWVWRAFVTACIGVIIWFVKRALDDAKEANTGRDKRITECDEKYARLLTITAAHEVMYELWLEELASGGGHPEFGTRKTDQLHRIIQSLAGEKKS